MSRTARRAVSALAVVSCAPLLVLGSAAPSAAGPDKGAGSTRYAADWSFAGDVSGSLTAAQSGLSLVDYTSDTYSDRVLGNHAGTDMLAVSSGTCAHGPKDANGVNLYGEHPDFARMSVDDVDGQGARVEISCVVGGVHYRYHWGNHQNADWTYDRSRTTNCVRLVRTSTTTYTLDATGCKETQVEVRDAKGKQTAGTHVVTPGIPFTATLTVPTLK